MTLKTPLGKVRGFGAAKGGTHHWWMQRLTAIALVPLVIWLVVSLVALTGANHALLVAWVANPFVATLLVLFLGAAFYHLKLGGQVVIEDYIHSEGPKMAFQILLTFFCFIVGLVSIIAVLTISFGG